MRVVVYFLAAVFLLTVLLDKTMHSIPAKELRRRARTKHDKRAAALYKLAAFGRSSDIFIRLVGILSAGGVIVMASRIAWWVGLLVILPAMWLVWNSRPKSSDEWGTRIAAKTAPFFSAIVALLNPILSRLFFWQRRSTPIPPTGIYEKEDLLEFLKTQARQPDNRMSEDELKTARSALSLSDKTAGDIMLPRRKIKWVAAADSIGPMVMDELHQSGQTRFPVVKEITKAANPEIVGSLYISDLLEHLEDKGRIRDIMHPGAYFINESQSLYAALDGFLKSGQHLLVVVNNFEEIAGLLTLEDVLQQIFGKKISDDFDRYHDIRSVASRDNGHGHSQSAGAKVE